MAINSTVLGPGTLTLGTGALAVAAQLTACKVTVSENVTAGDTIKVLSGEQLAGVESVAFDYALEGTFLQDLGITTGVVAWSWANKGTAQAFTFTPNTGAGTKVTGTLKPVPLQVGGDDMDQRMASDFAWRVVGTPTLS